MEPSWEETARASIKPEGCNKETFSQSLDIREKNQPTNGIGSKIKLREMAARFKIVQTLPAD